MRQVKARARSMWRALRRRHQLDAAMFDIYGASMTAGRGFRAADVGAANTVIVNRSFMQQFVKNRSPLGLRFRYLRRNAACHGGERVVSDRRCRGRFPELSIRARVERLAHRLSRDGARAAPHRLLLNVFAPATRQLAIGLLLGSLMSGAVFLAIDLNVVHATNLLLAVATIMIAVGLLAAIGPARRSLHIPASEAIKADT